jgi:hypothetical protein
MMCAHVESSDEHDGPWLYELSGATAEDGVWVDHEHKMHLLQQAPASPTVAQERCHREWYVNVLCCGL